MVYEGEQEGADEVAKLLIDRAVITQFEKRFPRIPKLEKEGVKTVYSEVIEWFESNIAELNYTDNDSAFGKNLQEITPLVNLTQEFCANVPQEEQTFYMELVLWSLASSDKLDKTASENSFQFAVDTESRFYYGNN